MWTFDFIKSWKLSHTKCEMRKANPNNLLTQISCILYSAENRKEQQHLSPSPAISSFVTLTSPAVLYHKTMVGVVREVHRQIPKPVLIHMWGVEEGEELIRVEWGEHMSFSLLPPESPLGKCSSSPDQFGSADSQPSRPGQYLTKFKCFLCH